MNILKEKENLNLLQFKLIDYKTLISLQDYTVIDASSIKNLIFLIKFMSTKNKIALTNCSKQDIELLVSVQKDKALKTFPLILIDPQNDQLVRTYLKIRGSRAKKESFYIPDLETRTWYYTALKKGLIYSKNAKIYKSLIYDEDIYKKYYN